ncbi:MAG: imidazole glycerol phosphate synthase subunit HisF [Gammaproteobacteria bacterium]|nr:imidazole glycerol phosphate synthase subunit HisF [Gammaproteobacteria bacterium]
MLKSRVIPCLLFQGHGLVKTIRFKNPKYVGDPVNAVRIFNEKEVDELIFLDIEASPARRGPDFNVIGEIASECFMPLTYGGGIRTIDDMRQVFALGVEKICLNTAAFTNPKLIEEAVRRFGSQSVLVSLDVRKGLFGGYQTYYYSGSKKTGMDPVAAAVKLEQLGVGELIVNSIDRDGTMSGYDLGLLSSVSSAVGIPVIALGGAGSIDHFSGAVNQAGVSAVAAGSFFVFHGKHRAVLISYPPIGVLEQALGLSPED